MGKTKRDFPSTRVVWGAPHMRGRLQKRQDPPFGGSHLFHCNNPQAVFSFRFASTSVSQSVRISGTEASRFSV